MIKKTPSPVYDKVANDPELQLVIFFRQTAICCLERELNEVWQAQCISQLSAISRSTFF